jgi:hypothetical protein
MIYASTNTLPVHYPYQGEPMSGISRHNQRATVLGPTRTTTKRVNPLRVFVRHVGRYVMPAIAGAVLALGTMDTAVASCDTQTPDSPLTSPLTQSYIVTPDESTAVDMDITYQDNVDFEADNPQYCTVVHLRATDGYLMHWYECTVPVNEVPRTPEHP